LAARSVHVSAGGCTILGVRHDHLIDVDDPDAHYHLDLGSNHVVIDDSPCVNVNCSGHKYHVLTDDQYHNLVNRATA
jgi:hypothetical protein